MRNFTPISPETAERAKERLNKYTSRDTATGCLLWTGAVNGTKYPHGRIRVGKERHLVRRLFWVIAGNTLSKDKPFILVTCKNDRCCEPSHLYEGTEIDYVPPAEDLTGKTFGRWTVISRTNKLKTPEWNCVCSCGTQKVVNGQSLTYGLSTQCPSCASSTHRMTNSPTYETWEKIIQRCTNPNNNSYHNYGGRGIAVCDSWLSFENFVADMGERPPGLSIERTDNNKGYNPDNCKWASAKEQARNRRCTKLNTEAVKVIRFLVLRHGIRTDLLASLHGVTRGAINNAVTGTTWAD